MRRCNEVMVLVALLQIQQDWSCSSCQERIPAGLVTCTVEAKRSRFAGHKSLILYKWILPT